MKYTRNSPCTDCPFLNKFKHGFTFQRLTELALTEMPCHKTCEIDEDNEESTGEFVPTEKSVACAGAMIFLAKRKDKFIFGFDTSKLNMEADVR